jgi:hypothetical protein
MEVKLKIQKLINIKDNEMKALKYKSKLVKRDLRHLKELLDLV